MNDMRDMARKRPELVALAGFGFAALVLLAVLKLASEIAEGEMTAFDVALMRAMRHVAHPGSTLTAIMRGITHLGDGMTLTVIVLLAALVLIAVRKHGMAVFLLGATATGTMLVRLLKQLVDRARPDIVDHWTSFANASYPSGHAANSAIIYLTLAVLIARSVTARKVRVAVVSAATALSFLIGVSRLYLGVHWPTDILAGWSVGAAWAFGNYGRLEDEALDLLHSPPFELVENFRAH